VILVGVPFFFCCDCGVCDDDDDVCGSTNIVITLSIFLWVASQLYCRAVFLTPCISSCRCNKFDLVTFLVLFFFLVSCIVLPDDVKLAL
jgi:hypothetical protein